MLQTIKGLNIILTHFQEDYKDLTQDIRISLISGAL